MALFLQQAPLAQPESPTASAGEEARSPPDSGESDKESVSSSSNGNGDSSTTTGGSFSSKPGGSSSSSSSSSNSSAPKDKSRKDKDKDKDKEKDKEKEKDRDKKRADSVANKLGSFGKSLGSKLKKNVGGLMTSKGTGASGGGAGGKGEGTEKKKGSLRGRKGSKDGSPSMQSSEDSGKGSPSSSIERPVGGSPGESDPYKYSTDVKVSLGILRAAMQGERKYIFAGLLTTSNRQPFQEEMIQRYLSDAEERFRAEQEQRREAERRGGASVGALATPNGTLGRKEGGGMDLGYRGGGGYEVAKEEQLMTDGSTTTFGNFKPSAFSPNLYSGVVPIPRPSLVEHPSAAALSQPAPAPLSQSLHSHGYLDTRRQLAGGGPPGPSSSYLGFPSYATLPRHCPVAQDPPHPQYHPPAPSVGVASPSRVNPCFSTYPSELEPDPAGGIGGGYSNGYRDLRSTLDGSGRSGPPPVRHYSLGSAGGLASLQSTRCRTPSCNFYGHPETSNYCSYCYREELKRRETEPTIHRF